MDFISTDAEDGDASMITNLSEFEVVLERYEDDPGVCSKMLRNHALSNPATFLAYSQAVLLERPVSRVLKFISGLAISSGIIQVLLDIYPRDRRQAITLAERLQLCDPRFDVAMVEFLMRPTPGIPLEESAFQSILELLDRISEGDRLVPSVLKLLKHSNPKIRSKAALFIGSRTQNMAWATSRTHEYDARVRANIIESLLGLNSEFVHQMFRNHVADENNRVAGNAVLGLYQLGDAASIPMIYEMSRHQDARFRNTAAWLMGRTGDPRFASAFPELMNDPDEIVRAQAFKGLGEVRKAMRASSGLPQLCASFVQVVRGEKENAVVTVMDANGEPVRGIQPIHFIVKSGTPSKPLRQFTVEEYDSRSSLHLAFLACLPKSAPDALEAAFVRAVQKLAASRRTKDRWAVAKLSGVASAFQPEYVPGAPPKIRQDLTILDVNAVRPAAVPSFDPRFEYSLTEGRIEQMIADEPSGLSENSSDAAEIVLRSLLKVDFAAGRPTWIILGAGGKSPLLSTLVERAHNIDAVIHVLAVSTEWKMSGEAIAEKSGGSFHPISDVSQMEGRMHAVYASLLHHYRISWPTPTKFVELDINSDRGRAAIAEFTDKHAASEVLAS